MRIVVLLAAWLAAGPALAQVIEEGEPGRPERAEAEQITSDAACARLAEAINEGLLPVEWEDEAEELADLAEAGADPACVVAFDLVRPTAVTDEGELPDACVALKQAMEADGVPDALDGRFADLVTAIAAANEAICAEAAEALSSTDG